MASFVTALPKISNKVIMNDVVSPTPDVRLVDPKTVVDAAAPAGDADTENDRSPVAEVPLVYEADNVYVVALVPVNVASQEPRVADPRSLESQAICQKVSRNHKHLADCLLIY